jgi:hypothetical protein
MGGLQAGHLVNVFYLPADPRVGCIEQRYNSAVKLYLAAYLTLAVGAAICGIALLEINAPGHRAVATGERRCPLRPIARP